MRDAERQARQRRCRGCLKPKERPYALSRYAIQTGSAATRVRAARTALEIGMRVADDELERRITRLEEAWRRDGNGTGYGLTLLSS
jgi:hypothetical protein